jgi:hypothetical protein
MIAALVRGRTWIWVIVAALALPLSAQEPNPAHIAATSLADPDGVELTFAWRFAPDDGASRQSPELDDSRWRRVKPQLMTNDLSSKDWTGVGWFRRHLLIDPALQRRSLALRITSPGIATVYLDGHLVLDRSAAGAPPEIPSARSDGCLVALTGNQHVLAVRYVYPAGAPWPASGIGFRLTLARPILAATTVEQRGWIAALQGGIVALPIFLALLHLVLFAFDRRARENLFYSGEMLAFALIVIHEYRDNLFPSEAHREIIDRVVHGAPVLAVLFGLLTYYEVRIRTRPRTWTAFVAAGILLFAACYVAPNAEYIWMAYFFATVVEVVRLERLGPTFQREGTKPFMATFDLFGVAIALQILVNFHVIESVAGIHEVYLFGVFASAVGMSLYLARKLGQSRLLEAEHARKSHELTQARDLQLSMLPRELPRVACLDIAVTTLPAAEVGGDYYDVRSVDDDTVLFAFGDATGHGLASGIVVTAAKALFASLSVQESPGSLLALCDQAMRAMQLRTHRMCLALARVSQSSVTVASAAMPPLLIHSVSTNGIEELGTGGLPLGSRLTTHYEERQATLRQGDTLLFASDGFAELLAPDGRQLGYGGVADAFLDSVRAVSAHEVVERLVMKASSYRGSSPQGDDITLIVVRVGKPSR